MIGVARVQKEFQECSRDIEASDITVSPKSDNLGRLTGIIPGPTATPYEGGSFEIDITLPGFMISDTKEKCNFPGKSSSPAAMVNWSDLPQELLLLIAKFLKNYFDILHFRAVCCSWRASVPVNLVLPPPYSKFRSDKDGEKNASDEDGEKNSSDDDDDDDVENPVRVFKSTISLFKLQNRRDPHFWLVKLQEDYESKKIHFLDPLTLRGNHPFPFRGPLVLDSCRFHAQDLADEIVVLKDGTRKILKGAIMDAAGGYNFVLLGDGKELNLTKYFRGEEISEIEVELEGWSSRYDDFIAFNGKFYAVDSWGRAIVIDRHSGTWTPVVTDKLTVRMGKKFLVHLNGKLLLVTRDSWSRWFEVYQLDEERKVWDRVTSLGDGILFLGKYCNFSVPAGMIPGVRGNCIVFTDDASFKKEGDTCIFHMRDELVEALKDSQDFLELFRPPLHFPIAPQSVHL